MIQGILGKKLGMTQIFDEEGNRVPVTVLEAGPCQIQAVKVEEKDGYNAVKVGYDDTKEKRLNKPQREDLKKKNLSAKKFVKEFRSADPVEEKVGDTLTNRMFQVGDFVDVSGVSKGKGFQGGMKRHNWSGGRESHGSMSHRVPGSIGASSYPSRVFKGQSLPGQMGNVKVTVQNIEVVDVNADDNTILVKGSVPGANGTYLVIKYAKKKPLAERIAPPEPEEPEEEQAEEATVEGQKPEGSAEEATVEGQKPEGSAGEASPDKSAEEAPAEEAKSDDSAEEENKEGSKE